MNWLVMSMLLTPQETHTLIFLSQQDAGLWAKKGSIAKMEVLIPDELASRTVHLDGE